jgi:plasmid stabilization system protein ParE
VTLPIVWLPEADAELKEARTWYAAIGADLAGRFALAVEATIDAIADNPMQFPVVYRDRRRAGVRRFPFGLFYEIQDSQVVVIACFHVRRNPKRWQSR